MIIDDLLDPDWMRMLITFSERCVSANQFGLHHFVSGTFSQDVMLGHACYQERLRSLLPALDDFFITRRQAQSVDFLSHVAVQPSGYQYRTHCDHPDKVYSIVTYLAPEHSHGTDLHVDEHDPACTTIEWQPGRTMIFAGIDDRTWHSYHSGSHSRATLCGFFVRAHTDPTR